MVAVIGFGACAMSAAPSARAPVPQSKMMCSPALVVTATHDVLPPNRTVSGPGVAIDPRVPQKRTRMIFPPGARSAAAEDLERVGPRGFPRDGEQLAIGVVAHDDGPVALPLGDLL